MNSLITYLNNFFSSPEIQEYPQEIEYLSPADQAYRDYFLKKNLQQLKLNLIA